MSYVLNELTGRVIGHALDVHSALGPGLLESAYEKCLEYELRLNGFDVRSQVPVPLVYKEVHLECGYRLDLLIENELVVEVKSIETIAPVHEAQILTYLKFSQRHLGLLFNFNVLRLKDGIRRFIL